MKCRWIRSWFRWIRSWARPPDPSRDARCQKESQWVEGYKAESDAPGEFVLDHARRVYGEFAASLEILDTKAGDLLRTSATLAAILVAAVGAFGAPRFWPVYLPIFFFMLTMVIAAITRAPATRKSQAAIRKVVEGAPKKEGEREAWLAVSLHRTVEEMRTIQTWKARQVRAASWLLCLGVFACLLVPICWWA